MSGTGYANRVIKLDFPDLSEDPENDPIWVIIRNPKFLPPAELQSLAGDRAGYAAVTGPDGEPVTDDQGRPRMTVADPQAAQQHLHNMIAKLVVAARVYDGTDVGAFDPETGEPTGDQQRLPHTPWTPDVAAKLPLEIASRIAQEFAEAANPPKGSDAPTPKTSSSPPNPSTTEPGAEAQSPQN